MKRISLSIVALMAMGSLMAQGTFTITGKVPGLKAGHRVELINRDTHPGNDWKAIQGTVADGQFTITGSVGKPTYCEIRIDNPAGNGTMGHICEIMVENMPMEVSVAHIDSMPPSFCFGPSGLYKLKNVTINGGEAQREYAEYRAAILDAEAKAKQAHFNLYIDEERDKSPEGKARLKAQFEEAEKNLDDVKTAFMNEHPAYHISGMLWEQALGSPFIYDSAELDEIKAKVCANNSPVRSNSLAKAVENARKFMRGQQFADFVAVDPDGTSHNFSAHAGKGKYTMVDFWASWCGPCRAAIPHVRELHEKYGDKLNIIATSVDEDDAAWRKAMDQEKMAWTQLRVPKENFKDVTAAYHFSGIPFMVLVDGDGKIVFAGHDPVKVSDILSKAL